MKRAISNFCISIKKQDHHLGFDGLRKLVSEENTSNERLGIWNEISEALPERSVKSCHNLTKRLFNPLNYKGHWTTEEERQLLQFFYLRNIDVF